MSQDGFPPQYQPQDHEPSLQKSWEESGAYAPTGSGKPFVIPMPPPNVTGTLHAGHALFLTVQDIMTRKARMEGRKALWIPGTDHAAIATESVVLKHLGITDRNRQIDREDFLEEARKFAKESHSRITEQVRAMGSSCDWSREAYTFDQQRSHGVETMFHQLVKDGLIYEGDRMINWSTGAQSVLSDDELDWKEVDDFFYEIRIQPIDRPDLPTFIIGTVRPETKSADSPIMIHPEDSRYNAYIGERFQAMTYAGERSFWIVADEAVDPEFGTGVMTISPAHDATDYELAEKHGFEKLRKIDREGRMTRIAGPLEGIPVKKARKESVKIMKEKGLIESEKAYRHEVPHCYRTGVVVEPMISRQWFIDVQKEYQDPFTNEPSSLKKILRQAVDNGEVKIVPERFRKTYDQWVNNLRDWCISRQVWWGHRIPAWKKSMKREEFEALLSNFDNKFDMSKMAIYILEEGIGTLHSQESQMAKKLLSTGEEVSIIITICLQSREREEVESILQNLGFEQDEDTLDTWFSSALWPMSTLGWPETTPDFTEYYPTDILETGYDILFFWVARMIMLCRYATGKHPFHTTYLHGLVCDSEGKKMSKSKGNGIDPMEIAADYGVDALRLALIIRTTPGNNSNIGEEKIKGCRNFCNKLWNLVRLIDSLPSSKAPTNPQTPLQSAIFDIRHRTQEEMQRLYQKHEYGAVADLLWQATWDHVADWMAEMAKIEAQEDTNALLRDLVKDLLCWWHPYIPHVTEALWARVGTTPLLISTPWPEYSPEEQGETSLQERYQLILGLVQTIRSIKKDSGVPPGKRISVVLSPRTRNLHPKDLEMISQLSRSEVSLSEQKKQDNETGIEDSVSGIDLFIPQDQLVNPEETRKRQEQELKKLEQHLEKLDSKLQNQSFLQKAPQEIVQKIKEEKEIALHKKAVLIESLEG